MSSRDDLPPPSIPPAETPPETTHHGGVMARFRNYFLTGLVVAGPIAITFYLTWWFVTWVDGLVRPFVPIAYRPETYLPFGLPGSGAREATGPQAHGGPNRHPIHIDQEGKRQKDMPYQDYGQPGRGVVGADLAEAFSADGAILHLAEIALHQPALAATGAAAQKGAGGGGLQADFGPVHGARYSVPLAVFSLRVMPLRQLAYEAEARHCAPKSA